MGRIVYDVPLATQAANPICWVTCMAMIASERRGYSVGVGEFTGGFDPSSASIPNPAGAERLGPDKAAPGPRRLQLGGN
jgi:hypothetical protein